jgi:hypothetical protein
MYPHAIDTYVCGVEIYSISLLWALDVGGTQLHAPSVLPLEMSPRYPLGTRMMDFRSCTGAVKNRKIFILAGNQIKVL